MSTCIVCEQSVDPETAHTVHEPACWTLLGSNYECDCQPSEACEEHCPEPACILARAEMLRRLREGARALLAGLDQVTDEMPPDTREPFREKFKAIKAQMGLVQS